MSVLLLSLFVSDANPQAEGPAGPVVYADHYPGSDIFMKAAAAFRDCGWRCSVVIPPQPNGQPYLASSSLAFPLQNLLGPTLVMSHACVLYTGAGYAIDTYETQPNPSAIGLRIVDGCLRGTPSASGAIRLLPTSDISISGTRITDFTRGDAILVNGAEDVDILGNFSFSNNRYGIRIQGIACRQGLPVREDGTNDYACRPDAQVQDCDGTTFKPHDGVCGYAGNMVHVHDGALANLEWDIYEEGSPGFEHLSNSYHDNELNGGGGGIFIEIGRGDRIASNYFEAKRGSFIVLGNAKVQPKFYIASATSIESNYFTSNGSAAIEMANAKATTISNNGELAGTPSLCFLDSAMIGPTYFVNNRVASSNALCRAGHPNANATGANLAHFRGDPADPSRLDFSIREDEEGNLFLGGPPVKPAGSCSAAGQWVASQDGHLSVCLAGKWVQRL